MGFSSILGQEPLIKRLKQQIVGDTLSHAYLFCGDPGLDPWALAKTFAKALLCEESKERRPCGACGSCKKMDNDNQGDFVHYQEERMKVEEVRNLEKDLYIKPYGGGKKVYMIDHGEGITPQGQNALLKTLEEPPPYGIILLVAPRKDALLPTIQSRCQILSLQPMEEKSLVKVLKEEYGYEDEAAVSAAKASRGKIRSALEYLEDEDRSHRRSILLQILKDLPLGDVIESIKTLEELSLEKEEAQEFFLLAREFYRDLLVSPSLNHQELLFYPEEMTEDFRQGPGEDQLLQAIERIQDFEDYLAANVQLKGVLEMFVFTMHRILKD